MGINPDKTKVIVVIMMKIDKLYTSVAKKRV